MKRGYRALAATAALLAVAAAQAVAVEPGTNVLVSQPTGTAPAAIPATNSSLISSFGGIGPSSSESARVVSSAQNNRFVAFVSDADGLSPDDDDSVRNVYVRDTLTNTVELISRASGFAGAGANGDSFEPAIDASGRYVAFTSDADNLVEGSGGIDHVYLRDRVTGTTRIVDRADGPNGAIANDSSGDPSVTTIGSDPVVAFTSWADNLDGASNVSQVFVRYFGSHDTERVSLADNSTTVAANASASKPSISADASSIAFETQANNLIPGPDNNGAHDVYIRRLATNDTVIVSLEGMTLGDGPSYAASVNGDGSAVAFVSEATNWAGADDTSDDQDIYVRTFTPNDDLRLVSRASGVAGVKGNGDSLHPVIDESGQTIVFSSRASNLAAGDANGVEDVFIRTGALGGTPNTALVSRPDNNSIADGPSTSPSIAGQPFLLGNYRVAYATGADNMGPDDEDDFAQIYARTVGTVVGDNPASYVSRPGTEPFRSGVNNSIMRTRTRGSEPIDATSADGRYTVFMSQSDELSDADDDRFVNVYRRDNATGETILISRASGDGPGGNANSGLIDAVAIVIGGIPVGAPAISDDGNLIAFTSNASNLVPGDSNGVADVFVRNVSEGTTTRVSVDAAGGELTQPSGDPAISGDGNRVAFVTLAAIDPQDTNNRNDVYLRDLAAGTTTLISRRGIGAPAGNDSSTQPALDADGSHVAFASVSTDLAPAAVNDVDPNDPDVWLVDVADGVPKLINRNAGDNTPPIDTSNQGAAEPALDADGDTIAFSSASTNLGATGDLPGTDVFVQDVTTGATELVSRTATTPSVSGNGTSVAPAIDAAGQRVAFESAASNLVSGDINGTRSDVFLRDLAAGTTTLVARRPDGTQPAQGSEAPSLSANGDCLFFESNADSLYPMPAGTDFTKVFGRALRGNCPFEPLPETGAGDTTAPVISKAKVKPKKFLAGKKVRPARKGRLPVGGILRYRLSEDAKVVVTIHKRKGGKRKGKLTQNAKAGKNRLKITGRVKKRKLLRPGAYRVVVSATDAAGNRAKPVRKGFKILRP